LIPIVLHMLNNSLTMLVTLGDIPLGEADPDAVASPVLYLASGLLVVSIGLAMYSTRGRLVDASGEPVATPFPVIGLPTPESGHRIEHAPPNILLIGLVLLAAILFGVALGAEM
jgi:hypothetical protein